MGSASSVLSSQQGSVVTLTLNRPDRMSALDSGMAGVLREAIEAVSRNAPARVVVLRGGALVLRGWRCGGHACTP